MNKEYELIAAGTRRWQRRTFSRSIAILVGVLALISFARGQNYEYAEPDEIKGLTRVHVDTGGDIKARNSIIKTITKEIPGLLIVDDLVQSQIRIEYTGEMVDLPIGNKGSLTTRRFPTGSGVVWIDARGADKTKPRLVLNFTSRKDNMLEKQPYEKLAKEFVKTYKKANGLK